MLSTANPASPYSTQQVTQQAALFQKAFLNNQFNSSLEMLQIVQQNAMKQRGLPNDPVHVPQIKWSVAQVLDWLSRNQLAHLRPLFEVAEIAGTELFVLERADLVNDLALSAQDADQIMKLLSVLPMRGAEAIRNVISSFSRLSGQFMSAASGFLRPPTI